MPKLIYSVEDDLDISHIINTTLTKGGYLVKSFATGKEFLEAFKKEKPQMILLDLMLPDYSGTEILKEIRKDQSNDDIYIIIVSAKKNYIDKVDGLDLGADDYIEKPFNLLELLSRVGSKFRRSIKNNSAKLTFKNLTVDLEKKIIYQNGQPVDLTNMEYEILSYLIAHQGQIVTRDELFAKIYGASIAVESRTLDMHIKSIRKKINDTNNKIIQTKYGLGYYLGI